jgi:hypothetical protein
MTRVRILFAVLKAKHDSPVAHRRQGRRRYGQPGDSRCRGIGPSGDTTNEIVNGGRFNPLGEMRRRSDGAPILDPSAEATARPFTGH